MDIQVNDVSKIYGTGENKVVALCHANMTIHSGDFISIMGPSGSGKSTLLHIISGLDTPTSGKVLYGDTDIHHGSDKELSAFRRQKIGFIFQQFNLLPVLTAQENIIMPLLLDKRQPDNAYLQEIAAFLGIDSRLNHLPHELSGGQQQRVAIARALIAKPDIIFADEPTGNLDTKSGSEVMIGTAFADFINNDVTAAGVYCLCAAVLLLMPSGEGDGKGCIEFNRIKDSAISWEVIFMCAVTLPIASAVTNEATGIVEFLSGLFSPIFAGHGGLFILIVTIILSMFLTNVGSNIAFGSAMIPIIAPFVISSGMNPMFAGAAMLYIINIGAVLPGASAPAAIFHSQHAVPNGGLRIRVALVGCLALLIVSIPLFSIFSLIFK